MAKNIIRCLVKNEVKVSKILYAVFPSKNPMNTHTKDPSEKKCFSGIMTTWQCLRHLFLELASANLTINIKVIIIFIIFSRQNLELLIV